MDAASFSADSGVEHIDLDVPGRLNGPVLDVEGLLNGPVLEVDGLVILKKKIKGERSYFSKFSCLIYLMKHHQFPSETACRKIGPALRKIGGIRFFFKCVHKMPFYSLFSQILVSSN